MQIIADLRRQKIGEVGLSKFSIFSIPKEMNFVLKNFIFPDFLHFKMLSKEEEDGFSDDF